jgi:hypothetical protein
LAGMNVVITVVIDLCCLLQPATYGFNREVGCLKLQCVL